MYDVAIIGGGASGLAAAVTLAKRKKTVVLFEKEDKLGKKILVSGNGRCNLSATDVAPEKYNAPAFVRPVIRRDVAGFFRELGLATREINGKIYPYSESATSVVAALRAHLDCALRLGEEVTRIRKTDAGFSVNGIEAKTLFFAAGSNATLGADSLSLLDDFQIKRVPFSPSVVPLITDTTYVKGAAGLRAKCVVSLVKAGDDTPLTKECGEVLFKTNGLSGIASMMLSSYMARHEGNYDVLIDFLPDADEKEARAILEKSGAQGFLHKAVAQCAEKQAREEKRDTYDVLRAFRVRNARRGEMKNAQVAAGGFCTDEFDENLQCKRVEGLYVGGEALDVDGECGGYNLHFAFACGITVGSVC